jgi:cysteinyl-tRNA synthetase
MFIYNSLSHQKEAFIPIVPGKINLYACGVTVYDYCHVGHARQSIVFDMIVRHLRAEGYQVTFVRNITDIDDKIIARAAENGESIDALTARFIKAMHDDEETLFALKPDHEPRATEYIPQMLTMIQTLIDKGYAYQEEEGDVYYAVNAFASYGKLSGQSLDALKSGVRIDVASDKKSPMDFVLWKIAKEGEPYWESPWGRGRPGWHIECSAMASSLLGKTFDIHGGGLDLKFPHHENEIAQSESCNGCTFVNTWMHTGLVQVDGKKMSKSLGNFTTVRDALKVYSPEVMRYFMLSAHYRSPLNFSPDTMEMAKQALKRLYTALIVSEGRQVDLALPRHSRVGGNPLSQDYETRFITCMNDDFNTPEALAILFEIASEISRGAIHLRSTLKILGERLGILQQNPIVFLDSITPKIENVAEIEALVEARKAARANKDFKESDRLRDLLLQKGIEVQDHKDGTLSWHVKG